MDRNQRMRDLGSTVRRIREFVGLSQERLARMAGVSQGAVSRLEAGRAVATPFLVVAKIHGALETALESAEPATVSADLRLLFKPERLLSTGDDATERGAKDLASTDHALEELVVRYRHLPPKKRATVLAIMRAAIGAVME